MFGPQKDKEGACNAVLSLADDYGDNSCTIKCQLPEGHEGPHKEEFQRKDKPVIITYEVDERDNEDSAALDHPTLEDVLTELTEENPNFKQWEISNLDLSNIDFREAYSYGIQVEESSFVGSKFGSHFFHNCNLTTVDLTKAVFESDKIDFDFSTLYDVRLMECDLRKASFRHSNLCYIYFKGADLRGVDFSQCRVLDTIDLRHANVEGTIFPCRFETADLNLADLESRGAIIKVGTYVVSSGTVAVKGDRCLYISRSTSTYLNDKETARQDELLKTMNWVSVRGQHEDTLLREIEEKMRKERLERLKHAFGEEDDDGDDIAF